MTHKSEIEKVYEEMNRSNVEKVRAVQAVYDEMKKEHEKFKARLPHISALAEDLKEKGLKKELLKALEGEVTCNHLMKWTGEKLQELKVAHRDALKAYLAEKVDEARAAEVAAKAQVAAFSQDPLPESAVAVLAAEGISITLE